MKLDRIYTRSGDDGRTSLGDGARLPKFHTRVAAYGSVDEANSVIGIALLHVGDVVVRDALTLVTGKPLGVRFDIDPREDVREDASDTSRDTVVAPAQVEAAVRREPVRIAVPPPPAPHAPATASVRITPELVESLRSSEPLIKALMDDLGATIVKVEPPETAAS